MLLASLPDHQNLHKNNMLTKKGNENEYSKNLNSVAFQGLLLQTDELKQH